MPAVPADPWSAGFMAVGGVATAAINDKTNMTNQASLSQVFDNSGWAVNIGTGTQNASSEKAPPIAAAAANMLQNPMVLVVLAVGLYLVLKK
jgi:hypothetical protein